MENVRAMLEQLAQLEADDQPGGEQFYQRRLRRAANVPAAEAAPEVLAFVATDRLLESVYSQLPCTALCVPALPPGPEAAERLLVALYKVAWTTQACPAPVVHPRNYVLRLCSWGTAYAFWDKPPTEVAAHVRSGQVGAAPGRRSRPDEVATGVAAQCLHVMGSAINQTLDSHTAQAMESVSKRYAAAALLLEAPGALDAAQRQLEELRRRHSELPPMTAKQLLFICHLAVAGSLCNLLATNANAAQLLRNQQRAAGQPTLGPAGGLTRDQLMHLGLMSVTAQHSSAALLRLDPSRVNSHVAAGQVAALRQELEAGWRHFEHGLELARQQRSNWFITLCCMRVIKQMLVLPGACDSQEGLARVQALLREAEAAWKPCTKLLPERWVQILAPELKVRQQDVQDAAARLQRVQAAGSSMEAGGSLASEPSFQQRQLAAMATSPLDCMFNNPTCDGCGKHAVGLRRCSRCRAASYCSEECQKQHWRVHKVVCTPAPREH